MRRIGWGLVKNTHYTCKCTNKPRQAELECLLPVAIAAKQFDSNLLLSVIEKEKMR
jgi:hypothetical protein